MPRAKKNMYDNVSPRIVKVIPLGGLEQIGMNMTVFEYGQSLIVVDAGLAFPGGNMPGVDFVLPDITYLKENQDRITGNKTPLSIIINSFPCITQYIFFPTSPSPPSANTFVAILLLNFIFSPFF